MDDQILSVLEKRVAEMEKTVFGRIGKPHSNETTVCEALLNSHTMIKSALSCRDNIVKVLQRLPELNDFLDPTYPSSDIEIEAKRQYILMMYPELRELIFLWHEYQRVERFADSEIIADVIELTAKLEAALQNNVNTYLECIAVNNQVLQTINKYNGILNNLEVILMQYDKIADQIEEEMKPKKPSTTE